MVKRVKVSLMVKSVGFGNYQCIKGAGVEYGYQGKGVGGEECCQIKGVGEGVSTWKGPPCFLHNCFCLLVYKAWRLFASA